MLEGGGFTVVDALEEVVVVVVVFVVEDDLLVLDEAEVDVLEDTVVEEDEPEPEPDLGNVDPMSPQRTLLWRSVC